MIKQIKTHAVSMDGATAPGAANVVETAAKVTEIKRSRIFVVKSIERYVQILWIFRGGGVHSWTARAKERLKDGARLKDLGMDGWIFIS